MRREQVLSGVDTMKKAMANLAWLLVAVAGAWAYATLAFHRGEALNSVYILIAALCSYAIGYRFYSKWLAARVLMLNDRRATPCEVHDDGKDFVKTNKWIVFGQHFAAISGPGPLVGPVLAAQFGYLPGTLWILIGVTLGGAVQDFVVLFASLRRDGKSLGQMVKEELNSTAGYLALFAILAIIIILLAVLALVVVKALAESPWGLFTVGATIPIAMFMGCYLRFGRVGKVREASVIGVVCLLLAVWGGKLIHESPELGRLFGLRDITLAWAIILYGLAASVLPVWLLLAPRGYLSTFMKLGTIFALALGHIHRAAGSEDAGHQPVRGRVRADHCGQGVSVLLYHHCLRRDLRLPHPDLQRHHAQDADPRVVCAAGGLWCDVPGIAGGDHGADRGVHDGPGGLFRHERPEHRRRFRRPGRQHHAAAAGHRVGPCRERRRDGPPGG